MTIAFWNRIASIMKMPVTRAAAAATVLVGALYYWASMPSIHIVSATYGENCGAAIGNANRPVRHACDGGMTCNYIVDANQLGDPAQHCAKGFSVKYKCLPDQAIYHVELPGETGLGSRLSLVCSSIFGSRVSRPGQRTTLANAPLMSSTSP